MGTSLERPPFEDSLNEPLDPALETLEGWTSLSERRFNHWYARRVYRGDGAIVDLGCMTGSSTLALAQGLAANEGLLARPRVHAYDLFLKYWAPQEGEPLRGVAVGESFLAEFLKHVAPVRRLVEVHEGDLRDTRWLGGPIEYLFVDAMKSWELGRGDLYSVLSITSSQGAPTWCIKISSTSTPPGSIC